jgi:hypothetical protein
MSDTAILLMKQPFPVVVLSLLERSMPGVSESFTFR